METYLNQTRYGTPVNRSETSGNMTTRRRRRSATAASATTQKEASAASAANGDYKDQLWKMADALRGSMDAAMSAIERDNPALKDLLPKDYARPAGDQNRLGQVVGLVSNINVGGAEARATDVVGQMYERFLERSPWPRAVRAPSSTRLLWRLPSGTRCNPNW